MERFVWLAGVGANCVLVGVILWRRVYRLLPFFSIAQGLMLGLSFYLVYLYFAPWVTNATYHPVKVAIDEVCIIIEIFVGLELLSRCPEDWKICFIGWLSVGHAGVKLVEFYRKELHYPIGDLYEARRWLNKFITIAMIAAVCSLERRSYGRRSEAKTDHPA